MSLSEKIGRRLFGKIIEAEANRIAAAIPSGGGIDNDEHLYRKLTGNSKKDLSPLKQERMLQIAYHLYENNPLAHRIVEMTKDFIVGEGITYEAADEKVKDVLDAFWCDPVNMWDLKQHQKALELGLYGEQCYAAFVNEHSGAAGLR